VLRVGEVPEVEIEFLPNTQTPVGLREPATTPVAPAIANAIFRATGARVHHLLIRPQAVLDALASRSFILWSFGRELEARPDVAAM
jgi:CO/xanthine dehydrogenase Mo-binding subunit